jgi:hypothetical protein
VELPQPFPGLLSARADAGECIALGAIVSIVWPGSISKMTMFLLEPALTN